MYPVIDLGDRTPDLLEQLGNKEKYWFRINDRRCLFKIGRPGTGENWAEKLPRNSLISLDCRMPVTILQLGAATRVSCRLVSSRTALVWFLAMSCWPRIIQVIRDMKSDGSVSIDSVAFTPCSHDRIFAVLPTGQTEMTASLGF
ncbi:hypothetical protein [Thiorhodovibrio frisius]|uniref:hypothetical protein n=1 Tax=Thiorhodovibrio frisius TaxID=631362 RepID=UPI00022C69BD|nr:hypothetical protein [Thiorhodovibrio frisius]